MSESTKRKYQRTSETSRTDTYRTGSGFRNADLSEGTRRRLVRLALRFVWNLHDAEDAVQEALHTAQKQHAQLRASTKWWSWLCRIVIQKCQTQGREKARRRPHLERYRLERVKPSPDHVDFSAESEALRALLPRLPARQREVLVLRHLQGFDDRQIAEILDIAPATVRVHAKTARESLCALLKRHHPDWFESEPAG